MKLGPSDRSEATQARYQYDIDNNLLIGLENEPAIKEHAHWKLIVNRYPYDERWCTSMLLVCKYAVKWEEMNHSVILEAHDLTNQYLKIFDKAERNGASLSSAPKYPHIHLLQGFKK